MHAEGCTFMVDAVTKFYNSLRIFGWFHHPEDTLVSVSLQDVETLQSISEVALPHGGVQSLGPNKGFMVQALRKVEALGDGIQIEFLTRAGKRIVVPIMELARDRIGAFPGPEISRRFVAEVNARNLAVLDIGGRARSRIDRRQFFDVDDYVVLDILPGDNVDVVGDAHALTRHFPPDRFDAFYSVSVFEHLLMPWAVIAQINKVLRMGGIGLISTHQTLGMHDLPWDYWRYSDTAWDALFNRLTGFEIIERALDGEQHVLPFVYRPSKANAERSVGFEGSCVWVRKIGPCQMEWNATPADLITTAYPDEDDNFMPDGFGGLGR